MKSNQQKSGIEQEVRPLRNCKFGQTLLRIAVVTASVFLAVLAYAIPASSEDSIEVPGKIEFTGRNLFGAANGTFDSWRIVESQIDLDGPGESFVLVEIDLASLDTGITLRDDHLRNPDFFEVETYPVATARAHSFNSADDESGFDIQIDLNLHGVRKTIPGKAKLISRTPYVFEGETQIDRTEFGVGAPASRWNPMSPHTIIPIQFRISLPIPSDL